MEVAQNLPLAFQRSWYLHTCLQVFQKGKFHYIQSYIQTMQLTSENKRKHMYTVVISIETGSFHAKSNKHLTRPLQNLMKFQASAHIEKEFH